MVDYYDKVVIAIVSLIAAGLSASVHPSIALRQGLAGGTLLTAPFLYEVLFRNPPVESSRSSRMASVIVGTSLLLTTVLYL